MIPNGATIGGRHTRTDFGMIPKSKIIFNPPTVKTEYVDITGASGKLDYTQVLTGNIAYDNRVGSLEFLVLTSNNYQTVYSNVMAHFHGQAMRAVLDDDPDHFYEGRFAVNQWKSKEGASTIVLDYNLKPYKYTFEHTGALPDWLWDDVFETTIYYNAFDVKGSKARTIINPTGDNLTPHFTCSAPVKAKRGNTTYSLPAGYTSSPGFVLIPGNNIITFSVTSGTARVAIDYTLGQLL